MAVTTVTQVAHAVNNFYSRVLLERAVPTLVHDLFAQTKDIPMNNSGTIKFRRYGALATNTTALTEGTTPTGKQLSVTDVTATLAWYGDYVYLSDKLQMETLDPIITETVEVLAEQAGQSLDIITRDVLAAGTTVAYAGDATSTATVAASDDVVTTALLDTAILTLKNNNAKKITKFVKPDAGYATTPVRPCFVSIVNPSIGSKIKALTGFQDAEDYANMGTLMPGELGRYEDIRFIESTQAKVFTGEGAGSIDVYPIIIFGADAFGVTRLSGHAMETIVKELGSSGSADPLNQRSSIGWKASKVAKILNESWVYRLEVALV